MQTRPGNQGKTMNDKTNDLEPPEDLKPVTKKKSKKKVKLVEVRNTSGKSIKGYNVIYQPGDVFKIAESAAEMLVSQNRVELVDDANSDPE